MTPEEIAQGLTPKQRADVLGRHWYLASCDHCGWIGSSQECLTDWCGGDDTDVYCPTCHRPGADGGRVADVNETVVIAALMKMEAGADRPEGASK